MAAHRGGRLRRRDAGARSSTATPSAFLGLRPTKEDPHEFTLDQRRCAASRSTCPTSRAPRASTPSVWHLEVAARTRRRALPARHRRRPSSAGAAPRRRRAADPPGHACARAVAEALQPWPRRRERPAAGSLEPPAAVDEPGGRHRPHACAIRTAGCFQVVHGDARRTPTAHEASDRPIRLAHVVLNSHDVAATQRFFEQALGFTPGRPHADHGLPELQQRPPQRGARRHRQRRAQPHRLPDARPRVGDARRRPHEGRGPSDRMGPRPPRPGQQRLQLFHRPVRRSSSSTRPRSSRSTTATWPAARPTGSGRPAASTSGASRSRPRRRLKEAQRQVSSCPS